MFEFFLSPENLPFAVAFAVLLLIAAIEGVGLLIGFAFSSMLDNLLPEIDLDMDGADIADHGAFGEFLSWLRFRQVPVIILLVAFLASFGITGYLMQQLLMQFLGFLLPALIAGPVALFLCLPGVRLFGGMLARFMPKDETEAVGRDSFIGRTALITLGSAVRGSAAQARLKDEFGASHYVMVEPDLADVSFTQGDSVLLVRAEGALFFAIKDDRPVLGES